MRWNPTRRVNETAADSGAREDTSRGELHVAGLSHRPAVAARSLPAHAQGRGGGGGRTDCRGVREGSWGQPQGACWRGRKSGTYFAPPVRRVHIPKGTGSETRPIGIPSFEDKVLQRAVQMVLEPLYEQEFLDCSYGFRPGRSAHDALQALWDGLMQMGGGWIIDLDIRKFFDTLDQESPAGDSQEAGA